MKFLLDTNVLSEVRRPQPDPAVIAWLMSLEEDDAFVSVLTIGELHRGALKLQGRRRADHLAANTRLLLDYEERILPVDLRVATAWGEVTNRHREAGKPKGAIDELLAATALVHDLIMVTRNQNDFADSGCKLHCPWPTGSRG